MFIILLPTVILTVLSHSPQRRVDPSKKSSHEINHVSSPCFICQVPFFLFLPSTSTTPMARIHLPLTPAGPVPGVIRGTSPSSSEGDKELSREFRDTFVALSEAKDILCDTSIKDSDSKFKIAVFDFNDSLVGPSFPLSSLTNPNFPGQVGGRCRPPGTNWRLVVPGIQVHDSLGPATVSSPFRHSLSAFSHSPRITPTHFLPYQRRTNGDHSSSSYHSF